MSEIDSAAIESYHRNGYLVVSGLVRPEEVDLLRGDAVTLCRGGYPHEKLPPHQATATDEEVMGLHDRPDEFDGTDESCGFDAAGEIPVLAKAGDVVFFNGYLLHRSFRNRSGIHRRVLVNHYMSAWSRLPWRVPDGEAAARADFRDIVMVAGSDPYEWNGTVHESDISSRQRQASRRRERG